MESIADGLEDDNKNRPRWVITLLVVAAATVGLAIFKGPDIIALMRATSDSEAELMPFVEARLEKSKTALDEMIYSKETLIQRYEMNEKNASDEGREERERKHNETVAMLENEIDSVREQISKLESRLESFYGQP
ncbi:MAG TPA: hypothetical protein DDW52_16470 [Planctomycetaceae bacterium]|nr:hypothetical protein [Planctomycetaceae bacterium]